MPRGSKKKKRSPASDLSDDLLVEIISRVPYNSTRCCKCVCTRWRDIVSHPDHRNKLPRSPLAGFFYKNYNRPLPHCYNRLSGPRIDPSLSFLPAKYKGVDLLDCCNGLLLCRRWKKVPDYMVCNPATQTWAAVPAIEWLNQAPDARLGFDPAVSPSHFHVFEFVHASMWEADKGHHRRHITTVRIYSTEAGVWTRRSAWDQPIAFRGSSTSAFLGRELYLPSDPDFVMAAVDVEGNCRVVHYPTPHVGRADVFLSCGQLYLATYGCSELSIWTLEDSSGENWILKHNLSHLQLSGEKYSSFTSYFTAIIHPEHNVISIVRTKTFYCSQSVTKVLSYNMASRERHFVCDLPCGCMPPYLPYVPLFSAEPLAGGHYNS